MIQTILIDTHNSLRARVDTSLSTGSSLLNTQLGQTGLDGLSHTTQFLNLLDMLPCLVNEFVGQRLHVIRTSPGVNLLADLRLVLDIDLGVTSDTSREVGRQGDGLIKDLNSASPERDEA